MANPDPVERAIAQLRPSLSSFTGWHRDDWVELADRLIDGAVRRTDPVTGLVMMPGPTSVHGRPSDGLEGFARTFLLLSIRIHSEPVSYTSSAVERYVDALKVGTAGGWPRVAASGQSLIEAASIAIGLHLTQHLIWDKLDDATQQNVVSWLAGSGHALPNATNNLLLFPGVINAFLQSVGAPYLVDAVHQSIAAGERLYAGNGWYADGASRSFDYYNAWAFHFYMPFMARMSNMTDCMEIYKERLSLFLPQHELFFGTQGNPVYYGRSLTYRTAAVAAQWMAAWLDVPGQSFGRSRRAASGCIQYFAENGAFDNDLMTLGWHGEQHRVAQYYSGSASPYWAVKGFFGLVMPESHRVWTAEEESLPIDEASFKRNLHTPGMLLRGNHDSGIVELLPYNASHDYLRHESGYNRLSYSNVTSPVLRRRPLSDSNIVIKGIGGQRRLWKAGGESLGDDVVESTYLGRPHVPGRLPTFVIGPRVPWTQRLALTAVVRDGWTVWILDMKSREPFVTLECGSAAITTNGELVVTERTEASATATNAEGLKSSVVALYGFSKACLREGSGHYAFGTDWTFPALAGHQSVGTSKYIWATRLAGYEAADAPVLEIRNDKPYAITFANARTFRV